MDERRKAAEGYRDDLVAKTKAEVDAQLSAAQATLQAQADAGPRLARQGRGARSVRDIAAKVLGREPR